MKKLWFFIVIVCVGTVLTGGRFRQVQAPRGVVLRIDIYSIHGDQKNRLRLTDMDQMELVLNYLRSTDARFPAQEALESTPQDAYVILVYLSNGRRHVYKQIEDRYLCKDGQQWKKIDPANGKKLARLESFLSPKVSVFS